MNVGRTVNSHNCRQPEDWIRSTSNKAETSVPYLTGLKARDFEKDEIDNIIPINVVELAQTEWASPVVFAPTKGKTLRLCLDYRKLEAIII